jgi:hypothetical protein
MHSAKDLLALVVAAAVVTGLAVGVQPASAQTRPGTTPVAAQQLQPQPQPPTNTPFPTNTPTTVPTKTPTRVPTTVPAATPTNTPITFATIPPTPIASPSPTATPAGPSVPLEAGVQPVGGSSFGAIAPGGGSLATSDAVLTVQALADPARPPITLVYQPVDARTLPAAQRGLSLGFAAFQLSALDAAGNQVRSVNVPINFSLRPGASDLALALGRLDRLTPGYWNGSQWVALPCTPDVRTGTLICSTTRLGSLIVPIVTLPINPFTESLDTPLDNGHFYTQGNGFSGGGGLGYTVFDDDNAPLWSEYQRYGGVDALGYPISNRFLYGGLVTQAFQQGALQWQPDLGQAVPINVLDDLHDHGSDDWLDRSRQVPPAPASGQPGDAGLLADYPDILAVYQSNPDAYGLPVAVKDYGQLIGARFQRSTLQQWKVDQPFAAAGTIVPGSAGDLAKAAGLWPLDATTPGTP